MGRKLLLVGLWSAVSSDYGAELHLFYSVMVRSLISPGDAQWRPPLPCHLLKRISLPLQPRAAVTCMVNFSASYLLANRAMALAPEAAEGSDLGSSLSIKGFNRLVAKDSKDRNIGKGSMRCAWNPRSLV